MEEEEEQDESREDDTKREIEATIFPVFFFLRLPLTIFSFSPPVIFTVFKPTPL